MPPRSAASRTAATRSLAPEMRRIGRRARGLEAEVQVPDAVGGRPRESFLDRPAPAEVDPDTLAKGHARALRLLAMRQSCTIPRRRRAAATAPGCYAVRHDRSPAARGSLQEETTPCFATAPTGGYRFLPGISAFSSGTVAMPGHEIVHVTLAAPLPWRDGFARIDRHLRGEGRPRTALCGIELRSPQPFTFDGFARVQRRLPRALEGVGHPRGRGQSDPAHERGADRRGAVRAVAVRLRLHRARHHAGADLHRGRRGRDARPGAGAGGHRPPRRHVARTACARRRAS